MAVYDDVHGWNTDQYLGQGEFYLEYGDIDYEVTAARRLHRGRDRRAPESGRGAHRHPAGADWPRALKSDTTIQIVTEPELRSGAARPARQGSLTWRFRADNVRDAAWAASPEYLWDAAGWEGVLAQAYYRPSADRDLEGRGQE